MTAAQRIRGQRIAIALMLAILVGYFAVAITVQFAQSARHGYGSGFSNRSHVPAQALKRAGLPAGAPANVVAARTDRVGGGGLFHDGWRLAAWLVFIVGIVYFYMFMMSRLGTI